ncbi:MAG TPA: NADH-quinone oxidoreductase subunit NuoG [Flavobacteriaceae bacterium]|nr:NADH-quinone oxidoreductase subunit NuoG [Flavobacteriaceae bacterium]
MATIYIDDKEYEVEEGKNLLEVCLSLGLDLEYFCWHPAMDSVGACRQCGVINYKDENDTEGKLVMACMQKVTDGMRVSIEAPWAKEFRAGIIEALMINHPHDCPVCDEGGECHLQDMTIMTGHNYRRFDFNKLTLRDQYLGPFIDHEMNRCIQCYRCVRFYNDYADGVDLSVRHIASSVYFGRTQDGTLENEFSGNLVEVCPTGVFTDKTLAKHYTRKWDLTSVPSICHGCSLGCNILVSERYGSIRRILDRYNEDVNGYFLCDRGRFGYEYTNSDYRVLYPFKKTGGKQEQIDKAEALEEIKKTINSSKHTIGIGSPRASLESNYMLQRLVGKENFYAGISEKEGKLVERVKTILRDGKIKTPSMGEAEHYDTVFIIGEDLTNTAPRLALSLRQASKVAPNKKAGAKDIPDWDNVHVRKVVQRERGPFYVATTHQTKLNGIATDNIYAAPDDIARLSYAVAHEINNNLPVVEGLSKQLQKSAKAIARSLQEAEKPLIVSGTSLYSESVIDAAASLAYAMYGKNEKTGLIYTVPEVNSMGLAMLTDNYLNEACQESPELLITLENDLFRQVDCEKVTKLFENSNKSVVLESLHNATTREHDYVLPAGSFAESTGTVVSNEGRAQRFYQTFKPDNEMQSSWAWIAEIEEKGENYHFDDVVADLIEAYPDLKLVKETAPDADYRKGTQKIPRQSHRFSGRTAINTEKEVSEKKPPEDPDSPMSYTMEGFHGRTPSALTARNWAPRWNSVQAINKQQIEVGGALHDGNPGKRLLNANGSLENINSEHIPEAFKPQERKSLALPMHYIYGSEELSAKSPAVAERIPESCFILNPEDATDKDIAEGDQVEIDFNDNKIRLKVEFNETLAKGIIGVPKGFEETAGCEFPFWTEINSKT